MQVAGSGFWVLGSLFSIFRHRGRRARLDAGVGRAESDRFCGGMRGMTDLGAGPGARSVGCLCVWGGVLSASEHSRWCLRTPHLFCFSRSVVLRVEIGPLPHRDRSSSASRSVVLRVEIGRIPRRDRSSSASRSVQFRVEIGPLPHRNRLHSAARLWCVRTSESRCVLRVWLSSVLHMGDQGFGGVRVGSCWNDGLFRRSWCMTVGLPCAVRGVCAHGSRTVAVTDVAVPHDSAVSADVGSA